MQNNSYISGEQWTIATVTDLKGYAVEWIGENGEMIVSSRHFIYSTHDQGKTLTRIASLPETSFKRAVIKLRPAQRMFRAMCYNVLPVKEKLFVSYGKSLYCVSKDNVEPVKGLRRPTRILRGACAVGKKDEVYFGEYISNVERSEIYIYRWDSVTNKVEIVYIFPEKAVRHVHGIYVNPLDSSLWCLTGDRGQECRIMRTTDSFKTLESIGYGDESWRAVSIQFDGKYAYYGTDAEFVQNKIYRLNTDTGQRDILGEVNGPVYYSKKVNNGVLFGVTAEPCPSQQNKSAALWYVNKDGLLSLIAGWKKDNLPYHYFMPGAIHFPVSSEVTNEMWISGVGLKKIDNRCLRLSKKEDVPS